MISKVFSVFDTAAQAYGQPVFAPSRGIAVRAFGDQINREADDNQFFKHPDDFEFYEVGEWNDALGAFSAPEGSEGPILVARGKDLKR